MPRLAFQADQYFNNKQRLDRIFGENIIPVDLNAGLVSPKTDKWGMNKETGELIEDNIQERFGLTEPDEDY